MPIGLKNTVATYQRAMTTLSHNMMHRKMEVNVDDMIAKFKTEESHPTNLQKIFERLQKYDLKSIRKNVYLAQPLKNVRGYYESPRD